MEGAALRNAIERRPIRPFQLVINSGDKVRVPHPEFISFAPDSKSVIVWDSDFRVPASNARRKKA
jgi:hypothetical protein